MLPSIETEAQALHRLARRAHESGVELIVDEDNRHWATSASRAGERHVVTLYTCDCRGFARHGRCMHLAMVLEAYHSLPALEEPDPGPGGGATSPAAPMSEGQVESERAFLRFAMASCDADDAWYFIRTSPLAIVPATAGVGVQHAA